MMKADSENVVGTGSVISRVCTGQCHTKSKCTAEPERLKRQKFVPVLSCKRKRNLNI